MSLIRENYSSSRFSCPWNMMFIIDYTVLVLLRSITGYHPHRSGNLRLSSATWAMNFIQVYFYFSQRSWGISPNYFVSSYSKSSSLVLHCSLQRRSSLNMDTKKSSYFHPLLFLSPCPRWRCYEVHDIVIECSRVSLDPLESSCEDDSFSSLRDPPSSPRPPPSVLPPPPARPHLHRRRQQHRWAHSFIIHLSSIYGCTEYWWMDLQIQVFYRYI